MYCCTRYLVWYYTSTELYAVRTAAAVDYIYTLATGYVPGLVYSIRKYRIIPGIKIIPYVYTSMPSEVRCVWCLLVRTRPIWYTVPGTYMRVQRVPYVRVQYDLVPFP